MANAKLYDKAMCRLTTIVSRLNLGEALDVKELAKEFNVSVRTIQKDLNDRLLSWQYPIEKGEDGKYRLSSSYKITGTENFETELIIQLIKAFTKALDKNRKQLVDKILNTKNTVCPFLFNINAEELQLKNSQFLLIVQAIKFRQLLLFTYRTKDNVTTNYNVHPYKLANFDNYWYLIAFDFEAEKIKTFYLKNISKIQLSPENFVFNTKIEKQIESINDISSVWHSVDKVYTVKLQIKGDAKLYLSRNLCPNMKTVSKTDNHLIVEFVYYDDIEVLSIVKRWLPDIKILDNEDLQNQLAEQLKNYLTKNQF